jgi:hypothetical protein
VGRRWPCAEASGFATAERGRAFNRHARGPLWPILRPGPWNWMKCSSQNSAMRSDERLGICRHLHLGFVLRDTADTALNEELRIRFGRRLIRFAR